MSGNVTFGGQIPAGAAWIGPDYAHLLQQVRAGQSPYLFLVDVVQKLFHPAVPIGFRTQLYFLLGLFGVCALLIITGLVIRLRQGRFWVFQRLDRTVALPNASTLFGLCALVFVAPFFEIWTTVAGWYVRKHGAHYRESRWRSCVAGLLPVAVLVIAWVPPVVLSIPYAQKFNNSFHISQEITADLLRWQRSWHPGDGLNMPNLLSLFTPGAQLGDELVTSHKFSQIAAAYCTVVFFLTFFIYILAASLEVAQLEQTIRELQAQAAQREEQARALKASPRPVSSDISAPVLAYQSNPTLSLGTGSRDAAAEKETQAASASRGNVIPLVSCPSFSPPRECEDDDIELKHPYAASRPRSDLTDEGAIEGSGPSSPQSAARLRSDSLTTEGDQYLDAIEKARQRWLPSRNAS